MQDKYYLKYKTNQTNVPNGERPKPLAPMKSSYSISACLFLVALPFVCRALLNFHSLYHYMGRYRGGRLGGYISTLIPEVFLDLSLLSIIKKKPLGAG